MWGKVKFECKEETEYTGIIYRKFEIEWDAGGYIAGRDVTLSPCPNCESSDFCVSTDKSHALLYCNACRAKFISELTGGGIYGIEYRWNSKARKQIEIMNHIDAAKDDIDSIEKDIKFLESETLTRIKYLIEKYESWAKNTSFMS